MIQALYLALRLLCQLAGEVVVQALGITFPGPVLGMGLLFAGLTVLGRSGRARRRGRHDPAQPVALFVPAAVGVVQQAGLIAANWLAIFAALAISTAATLVVTVYTFRAVARLTARSDGR